MTNPNIPKQRPQQEESDDNNSDNQSPIYDEQDDWMTRVNDDSLRKLNQLRENAGLPPIK